jgi:uncharacterized repeat protein (TIGR01451 family)
MSFRKAASGRTLSLLAMLSIMSALVLFVGQFVAFAGTPTGIGNAKITICHRTNSVTNPYVQITVAREAADGVSGGSGNQADHYGEHQGPIASSEAVAQALKDAHTEWGDIIPPVDDDGVPMPHSGLNWNNTSGVGPAMWANGCNYTTPPPPSLNVSIDKSGPASSTVGSSFSYGVTVTNTGQGTLNNVTVTDNVSGALSVTAVSFTSPGGPGSCPINQNVSCNVGTLNAGQSATVTITVTAGANSCPSVQNTASVSADGISGSKASDTITTTIPCPTGQPSLSLAKTGTATVSPGGAISYTVTVSNSGTAAATNVVITDNLNDSLNVTSASSTIGACAVGALNVVTCTIGTLAASGQSGSSATITINATAPTGTCPTITNQATGSHAGGTIPASDTVTTTVTGCPGPNPDVKVVIEKTNDANEDGIFTNSEESKKDDLDVEFKLVITNTSNVTVEITELTDSFDQTTIDLLGAKCTSLAGTVLDPGESVTCTFTLNSYSSAQGTAIVNIAEVCVELVGGTQTDCDTNPSRVRSAVVLGRTVTPTTNPPPTRTPPGGIAFTGPESAVPLTALAFALLTLGMGLLWAGNRKREDYEQ